MILSSPLMFFWVLFVISQARPVARSFFCFFLAGGGGGVRTAQEP